MIKESKFWSYVIMKAAGKSIIGKKLFNFYTLFIIIALSFAFPLELNPQTVSKSILYNYIEQFSFWVFDEKCTYSMYFPAFFMLILPLGVLYELSEKIKTSKLAFLNCAILSISPGFILFTKGFPEQSVSLSLALGAIYACFFTYFCKKEYRKYFWIFSCILLVLSGLISYKCALGAVLIILFSAIIFKKSKSFSTKNDFDKFLLLNILSVIITAFCTVFINTPAVIIYPFISSIIGHFLYNWIFKNEKNKVKKCVLVLIIFLALAATFGILLPII